MSDSVPSCQWASHAGDDTIDFIVRGQTFDSPSFGRVRHRKDVAVAVGLSGKILWVEDPDNVADILETFKDRDRESESDHTGGNGDAGMRGEGQMQRPGQQHTQRVGRRGGRRLVTLGPPEFLTPGFIDLHIHAPQYSYTGTATDKPLMEWLDHYTFPAEKKFEDREVAARHYPRVVRRTLKCGTTTAVYFASLHRQACEELVLCLERQGQRGVVCKVCMDKNGPPGYVETTENSLQETEEFLRFCSQRTGPVEGGIAPRFIPTCSEGLLKGVGRIAARDNPVVTSHMSESLDELAFVRALQLQEREERQLGELDRENQGGEHGLSGSFETDAEVFKRAGLLRPKTVMAHCLYMTERDVSLMADSKTAIAHCPLSNFYFAGSTLRAGPLVRSAGVLVGLGTDVAGGFSPSMVDACRFAAVTGRAVRSERLAERLSLALSSSAGGGDPQLGKPTSTTIAPSPGEEKTQAFADFAETNDALAPYLSRGTNLFLRALQIRTDPLSPPVDALTRVLSEGPDPFTDTRPPGPVAGACLGPERTQGSAEGPGVFDFDWRHAFHLATQGGAAALQREKELGLLEAGFCFDALRWSPELPPSDFQSSAEVRGQEEETSVDSSGCSLGWDDGNVDLFGWERGLFLLEKTLNLGDDRNISSVWVQGRKVCG